MKKAFHSLKNGETFHIGKGYGIGACSHIKMWEEFQKIDKSTAKIFKQVGYGNTRAVGSNRKFAPFVAVWTI